MIITSCLDIFVTSVSEHKLTKSLQDTCELSYYYLVKLRTRPREDSKSSSCDAR
jgi:hypothetical protein